MGICVIWFSLFLFIELPTTIYSSVSKAINKANVISLTKDIVENDKNVETQILESKCTNKVGNVTSGSRVWSNFGYFSEQMSNFNVGKVNYPENAIICINQAYLTIKNNKKMFYADHQILGQIIEALNLPKMLVFVFKERKVKLIRPRYEPSNVEFLILYETIGFVIVHGDEDEHFLNYGFDDTKSKLLYSFYKRRIT